MLLSYDLCLCLFCFAAAKIKTLQLTNHQYRSFHQRFYCSENPDTVSVHIDRMKHWIKLYFLQLEDSAYNLPKHP